MSSRRICSIALAMLAIALMAAAADHQPIRRSARITLNLPPLSDKQMKGTYESSAPDQFRYVVSDTPFHLDVSQFGRDVWMSMGDGAIHLTSQDLTDTEYDRLRFVLGPLGVPMAPDDQLVSWIERHYHVETSPKDTAIDLMTAKLLPEFQPLLRSWLSFQTGAKGRLLNSLMPDTLQISVARKDSQPLEITQFNASGQLTARMTFDFSNAPRSSPERFRPPPDSQILQSREFMLALGAGPKWLVGKTIPAGVMRHLDGRAVSMAEFRGRPMLLNFWATWCGPCRIEWPVMQELYKKHGTKVAFLLMTGEDVSTVRNYLDETGYTAPVYILTDEKIPSGFGVVSFPSTFFVDSKGIIRNAFVGFPAKETMEETLAALRDKYEAALSGLLSPSGG